jgi:Transposase DDE domain
VGLFSLSGGHLIRFVEASWKTHELKLAKQLTDWMRPKEVLLGDRGFCGWGFIALLKTKGVDVVLRLQQRRPDGHGRTCWRRPRRLAGWTEEIWGTLPEQIEVRLVRFQVPKAGFRTRKVTLATTLLDEIEFVKKGSGCYIDTF